MKTFARICLSLAIIINGSVLISYINKNRQLRGLILESQALSRDLIRVAKYWKSEAESYQVGGGFQSDKMEETTNRVYANYDFSSGAKNEPLVLLLTNLSGIKFQNQIVTYFIPETNWSMLRKMFNKYWVTNETVTFQSYDY